MYSAAGEDAAGPAEIPTGVGEERKQAETPAGRSRGGKWYRVVHTAVGAGAGVGPWYAGDIVPARAFPPSEAGAAVRRRLLDLGAIVEGTGPPAKSGEAFTDG